MSEGKDSKNCGEHRKLQDSRESIQQLERAIRLDLRQRAGDQACACLCPRWGHEEICTGKAISTHRLICLDNEEIPVCAQCKKHITSYETLHKKSQ